MACDRTAPPAGLSSANAPAGWQVNAPNPGQGGTVTFARQSLAAGASDALTLVLKADCGTLGGTTISNTATVAGSRPDLNTDNNSFTVTATALVIETWRPDGGVRRVERA